MRHQARIAVWASNAARAAFALLASQALAQEAPPVPPAPDPQTPTPRLDAPPAWKLQASLGVWYMGLGGDLTMPSGADAFPQLPPEPPNLEQDLSDLELDDPQVSPMARIDARLDRWRITASGFGTSTEGRWTSPTAVRFGGLIVGPGQSVQTEIDFTGLEAALGYQVWEHASPLSPAGRVRFKPALTLFAGARLHDVDITSSLTGPASSLRQAYDHTFAEAIAGARFELEFYERFAFDLQLDGGLGPDSSSVSIWVGFNYRPVNWAGLQLGYRHLGFDLETGSGAGRFEWNTGAAAGLQANLILRF